MATYPEDVEVLDNSLVNEVMESKDVTLQTLYSLNIPANTLESSSRLRMKVYLNRVVSTPLADTNLDCQQCKEDSLPGAQEIVQVAALTNRPIDNCPGAFGYVGEHNGEHEIYQFTGYNDGSFIPGVSIDLNPQYKVWRIRDNEYSQYRKPPTTTTDLLDHEFSYICGMSDEPSYGLNTTVTISSNAPAGFYLYFPKRGDQVYCPAQSGAFYDYYAVNKGVIYLSASNGVGPSLAIDVFSPTGVFMRRSLVIATAGYSDTRGIQVFGDYLYALVNGDKILKISLSNMSISTTYSLNTSNVRAFYVVSESLIYFISGGGVFAVPLAMSYITPGDGTVTVVDPDIPLTSTINYFHGPAFAIRNALYFRKFGNNPGYFYFTEEANAEIAKLGPVNCA